jgi:hypothetical protein
LKIHVGYRYQGEALIEPQLAVNGVSLRRGDLPSIDISNFILFTDCANPEGDVM